VNEKFEHIDSIIAKYLCGEATSDEIALLNEWKNLSAANSKEFAAMETIVNESSSMQTDFSVDTDKAWVSVQTSLHQQKSIAKEPRTISLNNFSFTRIAAMLLVAAGLSLGAYYIITSENDVAVQLATTNEIKKENLPDGSSFTLNKNSSISYKKSSFGKKRVLQLKGEAFFEVKHDEKVPFLIEAGNVIIEDIGTSFNVEAYPDSKNVLVTVATGIVKMYDGENNSITLNAGEQALYDGNKKTIIKSTSVEKNKTAYSDKILIFENTRLADVIKLLNDLYNVNIVTGNSNINDCRLTSSFNNEKIDDILSLIAETMKLTVDKQESAITLQGESCQ
jgi:transmembrane sensor